MRALRLALAVTALVLAGTPAGASVATSADEPALRVRDLAPLRVRGLGFKPRERIRLTISVDGEKRRRGVRATSAGRFAVTFRTVFIDRCNATLYLKAVGAGGSRDSLKLPMLQCPLAL